MCTRMELNQILKKMTNLYHQIYGKDICNIYLYGSYARGNFTSDSDIDIVAIVKGERSELQERLKVIWDIAEDIGMDYEVIISPTVIPYKEFEDYKNVLPYYRNIMQEGVVLGA